MKRFLVILFLFAVMLIATSWDRRVKNYAFMYIEDADIIDFKAMINPPEKYSQLLQLNTDLRKNIADYMRANNYKLKSGKQKFVRNNPTVDELINYNFKFEKIN